MKALNKIFLILFLQTAIYAENLSEIKSKVEESTRKDSNYFNYPLNIHFYPSQNSNANVLVMLHGYGGDYSIASVLQTYGGTQDHLISFDFPDHNNFERKLDLHSTTMGTIQEILPVIYVLKTLAVDAGVKTLNVYGFSAGAGALVNALAVLNTTRYDTELSKKGITSNDKKIILKAIENGWVLLDAPLKSMDELTESNQMSEFNLLAKRFIKNDMRPIDSLKKLEGLKLNMIVYFEVPDEAVKNRDDDLFAKRLKEANTHGQTIVLKGHAGGHLSYHTLLWNTYRSLSNVTHKSAF